MTDYLDILEDPNEIFDVLPKYQRESIEALLAQGKSNEEVAEIWLMANGPANTFPFGAENKKNSFLDKLKMELQDFICNEEKYIKERKQIIATFKSSGLVGVTSLATIIAPSIGTVPTLILPAVVLILNTILKMGVNAWCSLKTSELTIAERN